MSWFNHKITSAIRTMIAANVGLSVATQNRLDLPTDKTLWSKFDQEADALLRALPDEAQVLDLGGGRRFIYGQSVNPKGRLHITAVDISPAELALNSDVSETFVADVSETLPLPDSSVDLILSRALLEHVDGVPSAIANMARVLKAGGVALHMPQTRGHVEFPVVYDHCWPQALEQEFLRNGFSEVRCEITWACPGYFEAVFPLFLIHALWEWTARSLRIRRLAAYTVVYAVR
jgi:ubiquinone/menaquinone biosynthesis C-methylase UbiE